MIRIGEVILRERTVRNLTQQQLAEFLNVTKATISKWEKGNSYPDITLLPLLAAYFDLSVDDLLNAKITMTKEEIRKWYRRFAERFSNEPYKVVLEDVSDLMKLYYDDDNFLLQMAILLINHVEIAQDKAPINTLIEDALQRVEVISTDVWIQRQVNVLLATLALFNQNPAIVLERLGESIQPILGEEMLLSQAHEALGEVENAKSVLQVMMYQQLLSLIGGGAAYLKLVLQDEEAFHETIRRVEGIIQLYQVEALHPNIALQFYYAIAQFAAMKEDEALCRIYLEQFTALATTSLLPFKLKGDAYFTLLDDWFETLDLGASALREDALIRESLVKIVAHPIFKLYEPQEWFQQLQEKMKFAMGGSHE